MVTTATTRAKAQNTAAPEAEKRVILSMGGKGGVGKTSVMSGLAEWFAENEIPEACWISIRRIRHADLWRISTERRRLR